MENPEIKIYSFHYKPGPLIECESIYIPVFSGKINFDESFDMIGDDSGENISFKNKYYSELSGIYWVWKNQQADITGTCHYRRFLTNKKEPLSYRIKRVLYFIAGLHKKRYGLIYTNNLKLFRDAILNKTEITEILETYDAIFPQKRKFRYSVREHFMRYHDIRDLDIIREIIQEKHSDYIPAFYQVMNGNHLYANNMFILKDKHYQKFMTWWFEILFEFESRINKADYEGYQQRIMGFIAERLLTIWVYHQKLLIKELPVIYFKKLKKA